MDSVYPIRAPTFAITRSTMQDITRPVILPLVHITGPPSRNSALFYNFQCFNLELPSKNISLVIRPSALCFGVEYKDVRFYFSHKIKCGVELKGARSHLVHFDNMSRAPLLLRVLRVVIHMFLYRVTSPIDCGAKLNGFK